MIHQYSFYNDSTYHCSSEFSQSSALLNAIGLVVGPVIVLTNILVIAVICKNTTLRRKPAFVYMGSLAVADTLTGLVVCVSFFTGADWRRSVYGYAVLMIGLQASIFSLVTIASDRYVATTRPYRYKTLVSRRAVFAIVAAIWTAAFLIGSSPIAGWNCDNFPCSRVYPLPQSFIQFCLVQMGVVCPVILLLYLFVFRAVKKGSERSATNLTISRRDKIRFSAMRHVAKLSFMVVSAFFICWLPESALSVVDVFFGSSVNKTMICRMLIAGRFTTMIAITNSLINPIIYSLAVRDMRDTAMELLCFVNGGGRNKRRSKLQSEDDGTPSTNESAQQPTVSFTKAQVKVDLLVLR